MHDDWQLQPSRPVSRKGHGEDNRVLGAHVGLGAGKVQRRGTSRSPLTSPFDASLSLDSLIAIAAVGVTKAPLLCDGFAAEEAMTDVR